MEPEQILALLRVGGADGANDPADVLAIVAGVPAACFIEGVTAQMFGSKISLVMFNACTRQVVEEVLGPGLGMLLR